MLIKRFLLDQIKKHCKPGMVTLLFGARQVGKTTLLHAFEKDIDKKVRFINADELKYQDVLSSQDSKTLGSLLEDNDILIIDEAQRIENIGLNLKIMVDSFPESVIIASGSASFDLANKVSEPLTGRKITFTLYPVSYWELEQTFGKFEARTNLEQRLIWGSYPAIIQAENDKVRSRLLEELAGSYLYRDILMLDGLRRADKIVDLLRLVAFQIGQEVSIKELAGNLAVSRYTVEKYLDMLEKVFVVFRQDGFSRNLRKEISKNSRWYFYDNGVRNALIQNHNPLNLRNDVGQLWENYLMIERKKSNQRLDRKTNSYFWRTYDQKEIDLIEETGGQIAGYELKWKQGSIKSSTRKAFTNAYPDSDLSTITQQNFTDFIGKA